LSAQDSSIGSLVGGVVFWAKVEGIGTLGDERASAVVDGMGTFGEDGLDAGDI